MLSPFLRRLAVLFALCVVLLITPALYDCSPYICSYKRWFVSDLNSHKLNDQNDCRYDRREVRAEIREGARAFVVAALKRENTTWLDQFAPAWEKVVYVMDDSEPRPTVPANKGHEAMAYLTYIVDNYHSLPDFMVFLHGSRYQWHNEDPMYDGAAMLQRLQLDHVKQVGYANLRCTWEIGCPVAIKPFSRLTQIEGALQPHNDRARTQASYAQAFRELFPDVAEVPSAVGVPCGAQFAVTASSVRKRSLCEYECYRDWLLATKLPDDISGRIFEYSWHQIFGMPAVTCPAAGHCFCQLYGLCNLTCSEASCQGRYWRPPKWKIPKQWPVGQGRKGLPYEGWNDE